MIDKRYGQFYPVCDGCSDELEPVDTWQEAKDSMEANGWEYSSQYESNLCPTCQGALK